MSSVSRGTTTLVYESGFNAMPFVPVPRTAELEAVYLLDSQIVENTLYYQHTTTPTLAQLIDLVEAVNTAIRTNLIPFMSNAIQLLRLVGTMIDVADGLVYTSTTSLPISGGDSTESMSSNVAACISLRTGHAGRSFRGRNYVPAIPIGAVTVNTLSSDYRTGVANAYNNIVTAGVDDGWQGVVVSRYHGFTVSGGRKIPTPRSEGIATPISAVFFSDSTVDSQRRRLPGRGR